MAESPLLSLTQLERLEALWAEQHAPLVEHLQPGLTDEEIGTELEPLGLRVPCEAAIWWGWHGGVLSGRPSDMGGPVFRFLTLGDAVQEYRSSRRVAEYAARTEDEADHLWHPSWFPITNTGYGAVIACDCSVAEGAPTPIRAVHWGHNEESDVPVAESFGQMVGWWIDAIERGAWRYDMSLGRWEIDRQRLPDPSLQLTRLV
jgi:cell wall assembly regulator SMI1